MSFSSFDLVSSLVTWPARPACSHVPYFPSHPAASPRPARNPPTSRRPASTADHCLGLDRCRTRTVPLLHHRVPLLHHRRRRCHTVAAGGHGRAGRWRRRRGRAQRPVALSAAPPTCPRPPCPTCRRRPSPCVRGPACDSRERGTCAARPQQPSDAGRAAAFRGTDSGGGDWGRNLRARRARLTQPAPRTSKEKRSGRVVHIASLATPCASRKACARPSPTVITKCWCRYF